MNQCPRCGNMRGHSYAPSELCSRCSEEHHTNLLLQSLSEKLQRIETKMEWSMEIMLHARFSRATSPHRGELEMLKATIEQADGMRHFSITDLSIFHIEELTPRLQELFENVCVLGENQSNLSELSMKLTNLDPSRGVPVLILVRPETWSSEFRRTIWGACRSNILDIPNQDNTHFVRLNLCDFVSITLSAWRGFVNPISRVVWSSDSQSMNL